MNSSFDFRQQRPADRPSHEAEISNSASDKYVPLFEDLVEETGRIADNVGGVNSGHESKVESPYVTKEEAADYLRTTVDGIYGLVERGQLERCPGTHRYLFTKQMLDDCIMGRGKTSTPRKPSRKKP